MAVKTNVPPKRYIILKFPSKSTSVQGSAFHILDIRQSGRFYSKCDSSFSVWDIVREYVCTSEKYRI
jgi:hypothetical protein